jgi:hypothetical protein
MILSRFVNIYPHLEVEIYQSVEKKLDIFSIPLDCLFLA